MPSSAIFSGRSGACSKVGPGGLSAGAVPCRPQLPPSRTSPPGRHRPQAVGDRQSEEWQAGEVPADHPPSERPPTGDHSLDPHGVLPGRLPH